MKIQISIMDERDYILDYQDFTSPEAHWDTGEPTDWLTFDMKKYLERQLAKPETVNIRIRKWDR